MSGGKGGSSTTTVAVPEYIESAAKRNLTKADAISQLGYVPYYGPDVAAFSPMQNAAFENSANAASAFGLSAPSGSNVYGTMGPATDYGNGVLGYSSQPLYQGAVDQLRQNAPGQYKAMTGMFIDPVTGLINGQAPQVFDYSNPASYNQPPTEGNGPDYYGSGASQGGNSSSGNFASSQIASWMPGGVNDPNLASPVHQVIARATDQNRSGPLAPATSPRPQPRPTTTSSSSGGSSSGGDGGCVVATHAVSSGAFTPHMKREAVVWCMEVLHGKWWGEAIRRGYRHLGRKKIEQGKAHEHYAEFRQYIAFANGSKRDLRGALTFTLRTAQFFVVGMMNMEA